MDPGPQLFDGLDQTRMGEIEMEGWDDGSRPFAICQIKLNSVLGWISFKSIAFLADLY